MTVHVDPVSANSVKVPVAEDKNATKPNWRIYNGREISFIPRAMVKAQKFLLATAFKLKNAVLGYMAKSTAVQAPQREKLVISGPTNFTHHGGAGMSAAECRNPFLTVPVKNVAVELSRKQSIDPQQVAKLVADNPLLQKASPANGFFDLCVDVPVYKSAGPLRGSYVVKAHQRYNEKMSALSMKPIRENSEARAFLNRNPRIGSGS